MGGWASDEEDGEQHARFVHIFADIALVFTVARVPLFPLGIGKIGMKPGCLEGHGQVRTGPL